MLNFHSAAAKIQSGGGTEREYMVQLTKNGIKLGSKYEVLLCGSLFYFRLPRAVWADRIKKLKAAGYNCIDVYFPWNYHEREDGSFDFEGERDVRYFLEEMKAAGMYVIARPGPYICSGWDGGALPARILESGMPIRSDNEAFLAEVKKWYDAVLPLIAPYTYDNGGTIILLQLDNELDFFDCPAPTAYISRLRSLARAHIKDIPFFCCAGQYDIARAGGLTEGVEATLNCYPDSADPTFDKELQGYGFRFMERQKPLLVSETNRDTFLLRRELSCGSKLLGAYNQIAGVNLDYHQAVNNWGSPDAMIASMYDFGSLIDVAGAYRPEAEESTIFSAVLKTLNQAMSASLPVKETVVPSHSSFVTTDGGLRVLALEGGGVAVCVPNFTKERGEIEFTYKGKSVKGEVPSFRAPFFLFDMPLKPLGVPAVLTRTNCELIGANEDELVFYAEGTPQVGLDFGKGEQLITGDKTVSGVKVRFLTREQSLAYLKAPAIASYTAEPFNGFAAAQLPAWREVKAQTKTYFSALGISEGAVEYSLHIPAGKALFVEHPCDIMRVTVDGERGDTKYQSGRDVIVPPSKSGDYEIAIEKWGHSNFDDSQSPALRIASKKGATSFGIVESEETVAKCDFRLLDEYGAKQLDLKDIFPVRLSVDKWNSTRKPVICAYTLNVKRTAERLIVKVTEKVEIAVYLNGKLLGECDFGTFELTNYLEKGQEGELTLVYRKQIWTQYVENARLLHINTVAPKSIRVLSAKEMCAMGGKGKALTLPLKVDSVQALYAKVPVEKECFLQFKGKNVKLTCVVDGRVVGRLVLDWEHAPALHGGDFTQLYLCPAWSGELYMLVEPLGKDACLCGAEILK